MAYLDRPTDPRRRSTAITGVVLIHALIGYVLVTGLVSKFTPQHDAPLVGRAIPLPSPPPPTPTPQPKASAQPQGPTVVPRPIPLPIPAPTFAPTDPLPIPDPLPTFGPQPGPSAHPSQAPLFKPKAPVPQNDAKRWVTADDYPARDLREENEGTTFFRVVVGTNGRVSACEIVRSSGHAGLDAATCKAVKARARFEPAADENGETIVGTYSNSVRWQIPR